MKRLSEQFINSFTELKNNHVFRILIHSLWISHQKWYKSWSVALQRNVYGTRFNIILAYWHIAKCHVPCMTVNFPVTYFIFIFIRCVRTSVKTRNLVSRQFTYLLLFFFNKRTQPWNYHDFICSIALYIDKEGNKLNHVLRKLSVFSTLFFDHVYQHEIYIIFAICGLLNKSHEDSVSSSPFFNLTLP